MSFVGNGHTMNDQDIIDIVKDVTNALAAIKDALLELEARLGIVEDKSFSISEWQKILNDLGFNND